MTMSLPRSPHSVARRMVMEMLEADPGLKKAGVKFVEAPGEEAKCLPARGGIVVLVEVDSTAWRWETEGMHNAPLTLAFTIRSGRGDNDRILDTWHAILMALFPSVTSPAYQRAMDIHERYEPQARPSQIIQATAVQSPGVGVSPVGAEYIDGTGKIEILILLSTGE